MAGTVFLSWKKTMTTISISNTHTSYLFCMFQGLVHARVFTYGTGVRESGGEINSLLSLCGFRTPWVIRLRGKYLYLPSHLQGPMRELFDITFLCQKGAQRPSSPTRVPAGPHYPASWAAGRSGYLCSEIAGPLKPSEPSPSSFLSQALPYCPCFSFLVP